MSTAGPTTAGLRVLALDDDEATRRLLTLTLVRVGGCQAIVLGDPHAALAHVREAVLDLVIVDAMMPETTGLELYASIRRERGASLPIAFLSAASPDELGWDVSHDPRVVWLRKPFRPPRLIEQLGAFVRGTR
jgi:two-component system phosphate regulon response regulator PhoB